VIFFVSNAVNIISIVGSVMSLKKVCRAEKLQFSVRQGKFLPGEIMIAQNFAFVLKIFPQ